MAIASERYLAVCMPFKHAHFTRRKVLIIFSLIYIMAIIFSFLVAFQVGSLCFSHVKIQILNNEPKMGEREIFLFVEMYIITFPTDICWERVQCLN